MRVLVTGASGFIGRNLVAYAHSLGHEVVGTYLSSTELSARDLPREGIRWERLDMQDLLAVARLVQETRPDAVFHLAAQAYAKRAWADPVDTFRTNVLGTIALYEALRQNPPPKGTLLAASGSEYGIPAKLPIREDAPLEPTNPYGVSKATQDLLSAQYAANFGLRILRARLFGTTGPGKTGDALNDFAHQIAEIERVGRSGVLRVGNLDTLRDVSDVRDVVPALWTIFEKGRPSEPVNVGAGHCVSIRWIATELVRLARVPIEIEPDPERFRPTDERENTPDVTRLRDLGYSPKVPIERTVADSLEHWRREASG